MLVHILGSGSDSLTTQLCFWGTNIQKLCDFFRRTLKLCNEQFSFDLILSFLIRLEVNRHLKATSGGVSRVEATDMVAACPHQQLAAASTGGW